MIIIYLTIVAIWWISATFLVDWFEWTHLKWKEVCAKKYNQIQIHPLQCIDISCSPGCFHPLSPAEWGSVSGFWLRLVFHFHPFPTSISIHFNFLHPSIHLQVKMVIHPLDHPKNKIFRVDTEWKPCCCFDLEVLCHAILSILSNPCQSFQFSQSQQC